MEGSSTQLGLSRSSAARSGYLHKAQKIISGPGLLYCIESMKLDNLLALSTEPVIWDCTRWECIHDVFFLLGIMQLPANKTSEHYDFDLLSNISRVCMEIYLIFKILGECV